MSIRKRDVTRYVVSGKGKFRQIHRILKIEQHYEGLLGYDRHLTDPILSDYEIDMISHGNCFPRWWSDILYVCSRESGQLPFEESYPSSRNADLHLDRHRCPHTHTNPAAVLSDSSPPFNPKMNAEEFRKAGYQAIDQSPSDH